jgi:hypothetical protein
MTEALIYALRQLFGVYDASFMNKLGRTGALALASCSVETARLVRPHIERRYAFRVKRWSDTPFVCYQPRAIFIDLRCDADVTLGNYDDRVLQLLERFPHAEDVGLGGMFNGTVDHLPDTVTRLRFDYVSNFDRPMEHLPASLKHLTLGNSFNQPIEHLPTGLTHLTTGHNFNRSVDHLPAGLTRLTFGYSFNQPVEHLPTGLTHLVFLGWFNQSIDRLPASLTHLTLNPGFAGSTASLPDSLVQLSGPEYLLYRALTPSLDCRKVRTWDFGPNPVIFRFLDKVDAKSQDVNRKRLGDDDGSDESRAKRR